MEGTFEFLLISATSSFVLYYVVCTYILILRCFVHLYKPLLFIVEEGSQTDNIQLHAYTQISKRPHAYITKKNMYTYRYVKEWWLSYRNVESYIKKKQNCAILLQLGYFHWIGLILYMENSFSFVAIDIGFQFSIFTIVLHIHSVT